jgi:predicted GNAT superfamily acetyltransferase
MTNLDRHTSMDRVTDLIRPRSAGGVDEAADVAEVAARAAGVRIREIGDLDGLQAVYQLYDTIWRPDRTNPPVTTELLRALTKAGNYVGGAFDDTGSRRGGSRSEERGSRTDRLGELAGACVGFFGLPETSLDSSPDSGPQASLELHSHIAGVAPWALGRSIGFALKLHQRTWALRRGVAVMEWTFDPLVRRNAYFNLVKLGALPAEYLPNFYGGMHDTINAGDESDRLLARWELDTRDVAAAALGKTSPRDAEAELARGAVVALDRDDNGGPAAGTLAGDTLLVAVPPDIESLRASDPAAARDWRVAVRETLGAAMADGARVTGFDRAGWYVLSPQRTGEGQ